MVRSFLRGRREDSRVLCLPFHLVHRETQKFPKNKGQGNPGLRRQNWVSKSRSGKKDVSRGCLGLPAMPVRAKCPPLKLLALRCLSQRETRCCWVQRWLCKEGRVPNARGRGGQLPWPDSGPSVLEAYEQIPAGPDVESADTRGSWEHFQAHAPLTPHWDASALPRCALQGLWVRAVSKDGT